jgi:hypothetical protein
MGVPTFSIFGSHLQIAFLKLALEANGDALPTGRLAPHNFVNLYGFFLAFDLDTGHSIEGIFSA